MLPMKIFASRTSIGRTADIIQILKSARPPSAVLLIYFSFFQNCFKHIIPYGYGSVAGRCFQSYFLICKRLSREAIETFSSILLPSFMIGFATICLLIFTLRFSKSKSENFRPYISPFCNPQNSSNRISRPLFPAETQLSVLNPTYAIF